MDETIESLKIELEYKDNSNATKEIRKLTSSLAKLQNVTTNLTGLTKVTSQLKSLNKVSLDKINSQLSKFTASLSAIATGKKPENQGSEPTSKPTTEVVTTTPIATSGGIVQRTTNGGTIVESLGSETETNTEDLKNAFSRLKEVMDNVNSRMEVLKSSQDKLTTSLSKKKSFSNMPEYKGAKITSIGSASDLKELQSALAQLQAQYSTLTSTENPKLEEVQKLMVLLENMTDSCKKLNSTVDSTTKSVTKLGTEGHKTSKKYSGLLKSLGRIAIYRLIRTLLSTITNSIKTGLQNVAQYSEEVNASMSRLKSIGTTLTNTLGSMTAQIVVLLTPAIEFLGNNLINLLNTFNQLFATLRGQDTFIKATASVEDYAESLKQAKSAAMGIDELNVISNSADTSTLFETVSLEATKLDYTKTLLGSILTIVGAITMKLGLGVATFSKIAIITTLILSIVKSIFKAYNENEEVRSGIQSLWEMLKGLSNTLKGLLERVVTMFNDLLNDCQPAIEQLIVLIVEMLDVLLPILDKILKTSTEMTDTISKNLKGSLSNILDSVILLINNVLKIVNEVKEPLTNLVDIMLDIILKSMDGLLPLIDVLLELCSILLTALSPILKALSPLIYKIVNLISSTLQALKPLVDFLIEVFTPLLEGSMFAIIDIIEPILPIITDVIQSMIRMLTGLTDFLTGIFTGDLSKAGEGIMNMFGGVGDYFGGLINGIINLVGGLVDGIKTLIDWICKIPEYATNAWNSISDTFSGFFSNGDGFFSNTWKGITETFGNIGNGIKDTAVNMWNGLGKIFGFESGGFPTTGQLFIAREAGAELVGNIGNKTAVANNDQIVEGIKQGVFEATIMANQNNTNDETTPLEVKVFLDGKQIYDTVEKYNKQKGKGSSIYKGGVLNGI